MTPKDQILQATNGGLDIITAIWPEAAHIVGKRNKKFKARPDEKTASATLTEKGGIWYVMDFGNDMFGTGKPGNAIDCWMYDSRISDFSEAIKDITATLKIDLEKGQISYKPDYSQRPAQPKEAKGTTFKKRKGFTASELLAWGKEIDPDTLKRFKISAASEYTTVSQKGDKPAIAHTFGATEHYPIFVIDGGKFQKLYKPKAEKQHRFSIVGEKPDRFIFGLEQARQRFQEGEGCRHYWDRLGGERRKLDRIIICTGASDAVNVYQFNPKLNNVVWLNSETDFLTWSEYQELSDLAHNIYYLGDIDQTGLRESHKYCLKFLDLRKIRLPESLKRKTDFRGNPCKDAKDFRKYFPLNAQFEKLITTAYPYRFWDTKVKRDNENEVKSFQYKFNNAHALEFLAASGFCRIASKNAKSGFIFAHIDGHTVREVTHVEIRTFINNFVSERALDVEVVNLILRTTQLSENALANLPLREVNFTRSTASSQWILFEREAWEVTAGDITQHPAGKFNQYVWQDQILKPEINGGHSHRIKVLDSPFEITRNEQGDFDIEINGVPHPFLQFLINSARVHWASELKNDDRYKSNAELAAEGLNTIAGERLMPIQRMEQKRHLINRIYSLGYLLHTHKDPARPWAVWCMDQAEAAVSESHGGSGKSIAFQAIRHFCKSVTLNGRQTDLTKNAHLYENVTKDTDYIFVDDCRQGIDFGFFFNSITGDITVNPKHAKQFAIGFKESPKLCFTSNFALKNLDPSTERRLLYTVNSDYYHHRSDAHTRSWTPVDDLQMRLFDDFTPEQWNGFFNLMARCIQFYLNHGKVEPPMEMVERRNNRQAMGDTFKDFADVFVHQRINNLFSRKDFQQAAKEHSAILGKLPAQTLKKKLVSWSKYYGYEFNPPEYLQGRKRIIKDNQEHFFIKAANVAPELPHLQAGEDQAPF